MSSKCQGSLYSTLSLTSSSHPCSPSICNLNLTLLLTRSPYLARAVSSLSRMRAGLLSRFDHTRSPILSLSVHIGYYDQIFFVKSHSFITLEPFYLILDAAIFWLVYQSDDSDPVNPLILPPHSAGTREANNVANHRSAKGRASYATMHRPHQESRQGDRLLAYPRTFLPCGAQRRC